jgi:tRNA pseudouridine55 synthase
LNRIFVANKPQFISSNSYLHRLKRKYKTKKGGFSGTLDPFATGTLVVAFGQYTKLFQFLEKAPKVYRATLWLGAESDSLDIENFMGAKDLLRVSLEEIESLFQSMVGKLKYTPPKYSAKSINGERAYKLAREGRNVELAEVESEIYRIELLNYSHPFIHFEVEVSEGSYVRSIGEIIAKRVGTTGALSSLHRVSEGIFKFENERELNPLEILQFPRNIYLGDESDVLNGKVLELDKFESQANGVYILEFNEVFSVIEIIDTRVKYLLNRIERRNHK